MRKTVQVLALVLSLSVSTLAGIMQTPAVPPQSTDTASTTQPPTTDGEIQNGAAVVALILINSIIPLP